MGSEIAADDVPLDYVTFQILPKNRYGAFICSEEKEEMIRDGPLELLLEYLPSVKDQIVKGSCDNFKIELPNSIVDREWFTKAALMRILRIIEFPDALKKSIAIVNEMFQLEETRKFHLSLYTQGDKITSDNSKNALLQAMDSRIAALTEELLSTFLLAAGAALSFPEMIGLREFCQHFGNLDLRNLFIKLLEKSQKGQTIVHENNKKSLNPLVSKSDYVNKNVQASGDSNALKPVLYNASPAKAAEIERQSSTGSDESSSSEDDRPSVAERSRTLVRSASPRRSASPMRKVQIGRSGSRRTPALTIRSLPYFPPRERISSCRDLDSDCISEEAEESNKKTEINVTRMSVQDAISLFESRQRDHTIENQKKMGVDSSTNQTKAVLRRWSSGMSESQKFMTPDTVEPTNAENNAEDMDEATQRSAEVRLLTIPALDYNKIETMQIDIELEGSKKLATNLSEDENPVKQTEEACEKLDSAEWTRQKEEELNKMLMKFAEYNLSNTKGSNPDNKKTSQVSRLRQSGGLNAHLREKRAEEKTGEKSGKRVEKESVIRAKQRVPDKPKPEKSSPKVSDAVKKLPARRTSIVNKSGPVSSTANAKKESPKSAVPKKAPSKTSPLPTARKSWPSTPSPRVAGALPTRSQTITPPSITLTPRQKSQSPAPRQKPPSPGPVSRPSPKLEKLQVQQKDVRKPQIGSKKSVKKVNESESHMVPKNGKNTKIKPAAALEEDTPAVVSPAKGVVRKKVTKKSSVVPLEVKPSVRKFLENSPVKSLSQTREIIPQAEETLSKFEDTQSVVENVETITSDKFDLVSAPISETQNGQNVELEIVSETEKPENGIENEVSAKAPQGDKLGERMVNSLAKIQIQPAQESIISPAAWVESDQQDINILPSGDNFSSFLENPDEVASSGMRVRHSLSQMLLKESSEPDIIEWGNAEHPPSMVYQKDAPKGLKRLLKFARKNKEANGAALASPYTSEGEEDGDEYRNLGKGKSDNLLKVALHSKNYAEGFLSDNEPLSARSYASNSSARSSNKLQDGQGSSKGARSFFSLSAFRGKN